MTAWTDLLGTSFSLDVVDVSGIPTRTLRAGNGPDVADRYVRQFQLGSQFVRKDHRGWFSAVWPGVRFQFRERQFREREPVLAA